jgi:hypothetical protein
LRKITPIGEILVRLGLVTPEQVQRALAHQRERGGPFGDALIELGLVTRTDVEWALADQYDLPMVLTSRRCHRPRGGVAGAGGLGP